MKNVEGISNLNVEKYAHRDHSESSSPRFSRQLGLFVHWGLYAIEGWHEQQQWRRNESRSEYEALQEMFTADKFDAEEWLDLAQQGGMSYLVLTAKHLDGFCLWDTSTTDFNSVKSPFGRDVIAEVTAACRRRSFPFGIYFSVTDYHHNSYPQRGIGHEKAKNESGDHPDWSTYLEYMKEQVKELCTNYGQIDYWWWDAGSETGYFHPEVNAMIRELVPGILINNRGLSDDWDFSTPERDYDNTVYGLKPFSRTTEACQSVGIESWGYRKDEDYFSLRFLTQEIARTLSKGGNYLLNVGPMADGTVGSEAQSLIQAIGVWSKKARLAFEATHWIGSTENKEGIVLQNGNYVYIVLIQPLERSRLIIPQIRECPRRVRFLNTKKSLQASVDYLPSRFREDYPVLRISKILESLMTINEAGVIEMMFEEVPEIHSSDGSWIAPA